MKLRDYLSNPGSKTAEQLRIEIGARSASQIHQWASRWKGRQPSAAYAMQLEIATAGLVSRQELREDWRLIWPELASQAVASSGVEVAHG